MLADVSATKRGFALAPRGVREVVVLAPPVEERMRRCSPSLPTASRGRARPWRLRLESARAPLQRALDSLAAADKVAFVRSRASASLDNPPVPGFPTILLLPVPYRVTRMEV